MVLTNVNVDTKRDVGWPSKHSTGIDYLTKWNFFLSNPMTNVDNNHTTSWAKPKDILPRFGRTNTRNCAFSSICVSKTL